MKKLWVSLVLLFLLMGVMIQPVRADMAPPYMPPGSNVVPGAETTQVRMVAEMVVLTVSKYPDSPEFTVARTVATFIMRNLGTVEEKMKARFPLRTDTTICSYDYCPEITDLIVRVNGDVIPTERQMLPFTYTTYIVYEIPWAVFDVTFPPAKDVIVEVSYTADAYGYYPFHVIDYILETGAGWKDTIGSADIIMQFPYEVSEKNTVSGIGYAETSAGGSIRGNEIRWHFDNLEPTRKDNFQVVFLAPSLWEVILRETDIVTKYPKDGEAWGRLGKAYKEAALVPGKYFVRDDEMFQLSRKAYENCLMLLPDDSLWHFGYAELLWAYYFHYIENNGNMDNEGILPLILSHLQTAMAIDPNNQKARDLLNWMMDWVPEAIQVKDENFIYLGLTATPLPPTPRRHSTDTATPTRTPYPASTRTSLPPTETENSFPPTETPVAANPLCGSSVLIVPVLAGAIWIARRRKY